ncbi:hypothetical protein CDL12_13637 [Handroanthus impetiginosus]|uniref:Uncharacterized protein n=1 Tax=Handroanthus impetiginosus TaxID=429701 RepID=A0A2G9H8A9_9LAMI|nr:hypothetical protein CDL12_13637 [Handroanthus impetiginosus]
MPVKQLITKMLMCKKQGGAAAYNHRVRWMVGKAANRAAVHGSKLPVPDIIPLDEVEMEIKRGIEEKERKRREIENSVDSQLKNWQVLNVEKIVCSK